MLYSNARVGDKLRCIHMNDDDEGWCRKKEREENSIVDE